MAVEDDAEFLRALNEAFGIEAREHLQAMAAGLLEVESGAGDEAKRKAVVETVFREAHSLKGAARSVNRTDIEAVCQVIESVFSAWKKEGVRASRSDFDTLSRALDFVEELLALPAAEAADKAGGASAAIIQQLREIGTGGAAAAGPAPEGAKPATAATPTTPGGPLVESSAPVQAPAPAPASAPFAISSPGSPPPLPEQMPASAAAGEFTPVAPARETTPAIAPASAVPPEPAPAKPPWHAGPEKLVAETIRISTARMDALLLQAEEMLAVKSAVNQRATELRDLHGMMETWQREWARVGAEVQRFRSVAEAPEGSKLQPPAPPGEPLAGAARARLLDFLDWNHSYLQSLDARMSALAKAAEADRRFVGGMIDTLLNEMKRLVMLPFSTLLDIFPKQVRDLARDQGKEIDLSIHGREIEIDKRILEEMKHPLIHLMRNSIDHGLEKPAVRAAHGKPEHGTLAIAVSQVDASKVEILVRDDGGGIDVAAVKAAAVKNGVLSAEDAAHRSDADALPLIFQSGVSTSRMLTELSGRGLGMAIVREKVENLGGHIGIETQPGRGTTFRITLPVTLATFRGLLVSAAGHGFIIPIANVDRVLRIKREDIRTVENKETITWNGQVVSLACLEAVLDLESRGRDEGAKFLQTVILDAGSTRIAFVVDEISGEHEVLVKPLEKPLARVRNIAAATVLGTGQVVLILNVPDLLKSAVRSAGVGIRPAGMAGEKESAEKGARNILVADDSVTSRMLLKNILESAGYAVKTAIDGVDALTALKSGKFDLVVSDVEMPRMNGFDLTERIRADQRLGSLPVVLVTALESREHRERGIDVGANAYIVKSSFDQTNLLEVIRRLV